MIGEMQGSRAYCIRDPEFLAMLGALLLAAGDPEQALLWLERSLLLDPGNLGARADHAFALAELGQPEALNDLAAAWRDRSDVPLALRARLYPQEARSPFALPSVRLGQATRVRWATHGDVNLAVGYEGNLDRSPRLSELTLTFQDGPLSLPVDSQPRAGSAAIGSASFQIAYAPQPTTVLRSGLSLTARSAPAHHSTDWHHWQWHTSASHSSLGAVATVEYSLAGFGGPLGEPYNLQRVALSAELPVADCRMRLALEGEQRAQSRTSTLDSKAGAFFGGLQCQSSIHRDWILSIALRSAYDRPDSPERPGGAQKLTSFALRVAGLVWRDLRVEVVGRHSKSNDQEGFSPLLENNAIRQVALMQWTVDLSAPLVESRDQRLEATMQWQSARQSSNLPLFAYRASSVYAGVRWQW